MIAALDEVDEIDADGLNRSGMRAVVGLARAKGLVNSCGKSLGFG